MKKIRIFGKKQKKDQTRTDVVCYQITEILTQLKDHDETEPFNVTIEDGQGFRKLLSDILVLLTVKNA